MFAFANRAHPEHEAYLAAQPEVTLFRSDEVANSEHTHVWPLRNWLGERAARERRVIVHLDSDAFPVRDGWLERYLASLSYARPVVAVRRDENGDRHSDRCFLMYHRRHDRVHRFDFSKVGVADAGAAIGERLDERGLAWQPLLRSNRHDAHPVIAALYDDRIYHHGAGTRAPRLRGNEASQADAKTWQREQDVHRALMVRLFEDGDAFLAELRGERAPTGCGEDTRWASA